MERALDLALELGIFAEMDTNEDIINESCWLHSMAVAELSKQIVKKYNILTFKKG